jgi:hypothetical protein
MLDHGRDSTQFFGRAACLLTVHEDVQKTNCPSLPLLQSKNPRMPLHTVCLQEDHVRPLKRRHPHNLASQRGALSFWWGRFTSLSLNEWTLRRYRIAQEDYGTKKNPLSTTPGGYGFIG